MKKTILTIVACIVLLLIGIGLFFLVTSIGSKDLPVTTEKETVVEAPSAYDKLIVLQKETPEKPVEYNDYIYLGGPWGLVIGNKKNEDFQTYVTQNQVENVERDGDILQYKELNPETNGWEIKVINLKAYSRALDK